MTVILYFVNDCFNVRSLRRLCVNHRWRFLIFDRRKQCSYIYLFILLNEITIIAAEEDQKIIAKTFLNVIFISKLVAIHALKKARKIVSWEHALITAIVVTIVEIFFVEFIQQSECFVIKHTKTSCCKTTNAARIKTIEKKIISKHCNEVFNMNDNRWQIFERQFLLEIIM